MNKNKSLVDSVIDALPCEIHVPNFQFLGPGTRLAERLARGERSINLLERAALSHDLAYAKNENRRLADQELIDVAFSRIAADDAEVDERAAALITACCLVSKITLEKFCALFAFFARSKKKKTRHGSGEKGKEKKAAKKAKKIARKSPTPTLLRPGKSFRLRGRSSAPSGRQGRKGANVAGATESLHSAQAGEVSSSEAHV